MTPRDPWMRLSERTPARIALGRVGSSLPTREVLAFALAHARARDAVHASFDAAALMARLRADGLNVVEAESAAPSREAYLRRPDWGRSLSAGAALTLDLLGKPGGDVAIVVADGLSAAAAAGEAPRLVALMRAKIASAGLGLGPVVVARQARVALGDAIGERIGARSVLVLIGERPGLSAPESLGAYLTFNPKVGARDAERNCVSNIRDGGLTAAEAAHKLGWLLGEAFRRGLTGVGLKDESDALGAPDAGARLPPQG